MRSLIAAALLCALAGPFGPLVRPAIAAAEAALPDGAQACIAAKQHADGNQWDQAVSLYTKCLQTPGMPDTLRAGVHINRGNAYGVMGETDKALADFTRAIELNPNSSIAYNNRANISKKLGTFDQAIEDYTRAISLNPKNSMIYNNRGNAYKALKQYDKAVADFDKAVSLDPKSSSSYYNRACLESVRKNTVSACSWLSKAFENGFTPREMALTDADLLNIRDADCFRKLMTAK